MDNTFYIDTRKPKCNDYSKPIIEWGMNRDVDFGETLPMHSKRIKDLSVMLKYPYLYQHLGGCEHLVSFDAIKYA